MHKGTVAKCTKRHPDRSGGISELHMNSEAKESSTALGMTKINISQKFYKRTGFLLLEVIIVLFVLSLIVIPWYGFIGAVQKDQSIVKLKDFFLTKEVFLQAYSGEILDGKYSTQNKEFLIVNTSDILCVQLLEGTKIQQEIEGKKR